jgi:hypothetical protein
MSQLARIPVLMFLLLAMCLRGPGMAMSDEGRPAGPGPGQPLELSLSLDRAMASQGEAVPFAVTLSHSSQKPVSVTSFLGGNRSVKITLKGPGGRTWTADQLSHLERDGMIGVTGMRLKGSHLSR